MIPRWLRALFGSRSQPAARPTVAPIASHVQHCDCMVCTHRQISGACLYATLHPMACGHVTRDVVTATGVTRIRIVVMQEPAFQKVFGNILGPVGGRHES